MTAVFWWAGWAFVVVPWIKSHTPRTVGHFRSRWCCAKGRIELWSLGQLPRHPLKPLMAFCL
jgi:hypothetical protein